MEFAVDGEDLDFNELSQTLPACKRCRANRRRCDLNLPSCRNCFKAKTECIFHDHVLGEDLPRSYVSSLVSRLTQLRRPNAPLLVERARAEGDISPQSTSARCLTDQSEVTDPAPLVSRGAANVQNVYARDAPRYIGSSSCLMENLAFLGNHANAESVAAHPSFEQGLALLEEAAEDLIVRPQMHQFLVQIYRTSIHRLYPFIDLDFSCFSVENAFGSLLSSEYFMTQMIYAIACYCISRDGSQFLPLARSCHRRAIAHVSEATAELRIRTLECVTLMALYSLFDPQSGNFGQLVGFAARLVIDLESYDIKGIETKMRNLYNSIYCLEIQYTISLDRPSFLPEPTWPMDLDSKEPSELLSSLYRLQSIARGKRHLDQTELLEGLDLTLLERHLESLHPTIPNLTSTLLETHLVLGVQNCRIAVASSLLESYSHPQSIHTFLTPHWICQAGVILLGDLDAGLPGPPLSLASRCAMCLNLLDRNASRWPGAAAWAASIRSYIHEKGNTSATNRYGPERSQGSVVPTAWFASVYAAGRNDN